MTRETLLLEKSEVIKHKIEMKNNTAAASKSVAWVCVRGKTLYRSLALKYSLISYHGNMLHNKWTIFIVQETQA